MSLRYNRKKLKVNSDWMSKGSAKKSNHRIESLNQINLFMVETYDSWSIYDGTFNETTDD